MSTIMITEAQLVCLIEALGKDLDGPDVWLKIIQEVRRLKEFAQAMVRAQRLATRLTTSPT